MFLSPGSGPSCSCMPVRTSLTRKRELVGVSVAFSRLPFVQMYSLSHHPPSPLSCSPVVHSDPVQEQQHHTVFVIYHSVCTRRMLLRGARAAAANSALPDRLRLHPHFLLKHERPFAAGPRTLALFFFSWNRIELPLLASGEQANEEECSQTHHSHGDTDVDSQRVLCYTHK